MRRRVERGWGRSEAVLAQRMVVTKRGPVKSWMTTSHLFQAPVLSGGEEDVEAGGSGFGGFWGYDSGWWLLFGGLVLLLFVLMG
jgi:hypothetical protein